MYPVLALKIVSGLILNYNYCIQPSYHKASFNVDNNRSLCSVANCLPLSRTVIRPNNLQQAIIPWFAKVTEVVQSCNNHIRALRHIRPLLTFDAANVVGHSIVSSRLDYANALLYGTSAANIHRLQVVQNSLARVICQASRSASATELRQQLHWLPVRQRIYLQTGCHHLQDQNNVYFNLPVT